jgi:serine/threonine protein kinase
MASLNEIRKLGTGLQGSVSLVADQYGHFAVKQYKHKASFTREYDVLSRLGGLRNVMQMRATPIDVGDMGLPLQFYSNGELFDFMEQSGPMNERLAKTVFYQVLNGIRETHERGIAHLDIKPENIYVDEQFQVVIGDYGLATLPSCRTSEEVRGTMSYMAPEVVQCYMQGTAYDTLSADIWSLGVLMFIMLTGNNPFGPNHASKKDWYFVQILKGNWAGFWAEHEKYSTPLSNGAKAFIQKCLTPSITSRPTAEALMVDEFWGSGMLSEGDYREEMSRIKEEMEVKMKM